MPLNVVVVGSDEPISQDKLGLKNAQKVQAIAPNTFLVVSKLAAPGLVSPLKGALKATPFYVFPVYSDSWQGIPATDEIKRILTEEGEDGPSALAVNLAPPI